MFGTAPIAVLPPVAPAMGIHSVPSPAPYPYYYGQPQPHHQPQPQPHHQPQPQMHSAPQTAPCSCPECWSYYNSNYYYQQQPQQQQQPKRLSLSTTSSYAHNPYMPVVTEDVVLTPPTPLIATPTVPQAFSSTNTTRMTNVNFNNIVGNMVEMAKTSHGSSYIQACLREYNVERFHAVCNEILPHAMELLIDTHGCYVVRTLMEQMAREDLAAFVKSQLAKSEAVVLELCTASLHSRRIVQFLLESLDATSCEFMVDLVLRKCSEISRTQQGCIVVQRVLDRATIDERKTIFDIIQRNVVSFAMDPYANYVVQYMFENGDKESNSQCIFDYFVGNVISLACDKYASNVVEKALHFTTQEAQHAIVEELYSVEDPERLVAMIQDSYGNYIIQSTIALCSFRDVWMIAEKLNPVLMNTPYGYKIASKLERRLKGKALGSA